MHSAQQSNWHGRPGINGPLAAVRVNPVQKPYFMTICCLHVSIDMGIMDATSNKMCLAFLSGRTN